MEKTKPSISNLFGLLRPRQTRDEIPAPSVEKQRELIHMPLQISARDNYWNTVALECADFERKHYRFPSAEEFKKIDSSVMEKLGILVLERTVVVEDYVYAAKKAAPS